MKKVLPWLCIGSMAFMSFYCKEEVVCVCVNNAMNGVEIDRFEAESTIDCSEREADLNSMSMYGDVSCKNEL